MSLQQIIETAWDEHSPWLVFLVPLSWIYLCIVTLRRKCYEWGLLKRQAFKTPVIVVGNIRVGGTGKTPFVIALVLYLQEKGLRVGVVSRGYGAQCKQFPHEVTSTDTAAYCGDEPCLIQQKTQALVMIDPDRCRGIQQLIFQHSPDVIVCDDGLQHYALKPGYSVLIHPHEARPTIHCLPAGPLREPLSRLTDFDSLIQDLALTLEPLDLDPSWRYTLVTGIARPERVSLSLSRMGIDAQLKAFPDHHAFTAEDFTEIHGPIIMTEKDWIKCQALFLAQPVHVLRMKAELPERFKQQINRYLGLRS
jgi:tetraacyldisaccharide 4'-kinase